MPRRAPCRPARASRARGARPGSRARRHRFLRRGGRRSPPRRSPCCGRARALARRGSARARGPASRPASRCPRRSPRPAGASGRARTRGSRRASGGRSSRESRPQRTGASGRRAYAQGVARLLSGRLISPALGALALVLAFIQRPGDAYSDTRLELSADPSLFLARVGDVWSSTTDLGHVQSGQFVGYLFPMGPWFAAADCTRHLHVGRAAAVARRCCSRSPRGARCG